MANVKITDLTADTPASGDEIPIHDSSGGDTNKITIADLAGNGLASGSPIDVGGGDGITVNASDIQVAAADIAGAGLTTSGTPANLDVDEANVDHDALQNFVANEHVDHSTVSILSGNALTGGGDLTADRTLGVASGGIQTDELDLSIAPTWTGQHTFNADVTLGMGSQNYLLTASSDNRLEFQGQTSGDKSAVRVFAADGDGTDEVAFEVWGVGTPGAISDRERFFVRYNSVGRIDLRTEARGTGTLRPIHLHTGSNTDQAVFRTDGNVAMANSLKVGGTGAASGGALEVAGDLNINPTNTYSPTNDTTDRTFDADSTTTAELADVLATLIRDLGMDA